MGLFRIQSNSQVCSGRKSGYKSTDPGDGRAMGNRILIIKKIMEEQGLETGLLQYIRFL